MHINERNLHTKKNISQIVDEKFNFPVYPISSEALWNFQKDRWKWKLNKRNKQKREKNQ